MKRKTAQAIASAKNRIIVKPIARPTGNAGVSSISSAAGRNWRAVSSRRHRDSLGFGRTSFGNVSTDDMQTRLQLMEGGVASGGMSMVCRRGEDRPASRTTCSKLPPKPSPPPDCRALT